MMIPAVPSSATIPSIFVAYRRSGAISVHDTEMPSNMPWPRDARELSKRLHGSIDARKLIERHSMVPLFNAFCSNDDPKRLIDARVAGKPLQTYSLGQGVFAIGIREPARRCPECVREDLKDFGFAHWHVHHQVRQVRHCIKHRCALESGCARCGEPFVVKLAWQGADEGCKRCGSEAGLHAAIDQLPVSKGYWTFLSAIQRCLQGSRDIIVRQPLKDFNTYRKRETTAQTHARIDMILGYFGARSDEEFARILCFDFSRADLFDLFRAAEGASKATARNYYTPLWLALCTYSHYERGEIEREAALRSVEARADPAWDYWDLS